MIPSIGPLEIAIVLVIALIVFGPKRIPELGGSLGKGIRDFGRGLKGDDEAPTAIEDHTEPAQARSATSPPPG